MNSQVIYNTELDRLRSYSSIFSRSVFTRIVKFDDFSSIDQIGRVYDYDRIAKNTTYGDYLNWMYLSLLSKYRTEYVFKNALINKIISANKNRNITFFNEFKVGDSIADVATFNGHSRVYEIKTALDTPRRLEGQMESYFKFFQECYLVVPKELAENYLTCVDERMGILTVNETRGKITISPYRKALRMKNNLDVDVLMRVLWISEYETIVKRVFGKLPNVGYFEMFDACKEQLRRVPVEKLSRIVIEEIKHRKSSELLFDNTQKNLTQICLALNFNTRQYVRLCNNLNKIIRL